MGVDVDPLPHLTGRKDGLKHTNAQLKYGATIGQCCS